MSSTRVESTSIESRTQVLSGLSDPVRIRILDLLGGGERCVCEIQQALAIAPNLLSYHLKVLREAGLVEARRRGRWVDYRLASDAAVRIGRALPAGLVAG